MSDDDEPESLGDLALPGPAALQSLFDYFFGEARPLFNLGSKSLRPLYRIDTTGGAVTVTFDLPYVEKKDIALTSTENSVELDAKTRKPVNLMVGGSVQKSVVFERYNVRINLPTIVQPEKAKATFRNGLLRVKFPIAKRGNKVKIR